MTTLTGCETPVIIPDVPGLRVSIVPGPEGAKIDIRALNVCIDPLVFRNCRLIAACVVKPKLL